MPHANNNMAWPTRRAGMTLVELLIVMTIIGVMASLSIGAVFKLRESQMKSFTETTVQKLASAVDQQWKAALDQIRDEISSPPPPPPAGTPETQRIYIAWSWALQTAGGEPRRAKAIYTKARLNQEFPVTFDRAKRPVPFTNSPYGQVLASVSSAGNQEWESSALLYLALKRGRRGMAAFNPDEVDPSAVQTKTTANGQQFTIFVDAWGQPLRYYIFPYSNPELNEPPYVTNPSDKRGIDPQDPEATFVGFTSPIFEQAIHPVINKAGYVRHLIPVVASPGRDGAWGIGPLWMEITNQDQANDNIYSYRLRQVGARGD